MTTEIVIKNIDKEKFFSRYFFYVTSGGKNKNESIKLTKKLRKHNPVFLIRKKGNLIGAFKNEIKDEGIKKLSFVEFDEFSGYDIFDMALRALSYEKYKEFGADFYVTKLYYVLESKKNFIKALEFKFNNQERCLEMNVKSFFKIKSAPNVFPKYELLGKSLVYSEKDENVYISKSFDKKNKVDFLVFKKDSKLKKTKMYALKEVVKSIKECFEEIEWEFKDFEMKTYFYASNKKKKNITSEMKKAILGEIEKINIVNYCSCEIGFLEEFLKKNGIKYEYSDSIKEGYNLTITKNKEEYDEGEDPYHKGESENTYIQNIMESSLKDLKKEKNKNATFENLLKELVVKKEVKTKKIILPEHIPDEKIVFFLKEKDKIYGVEVEKDRLNFDINVFPAEKYNGIFKNGDMILIKGKNVNLIKDTKKYVIFNPLRLDEIEEGVDFRRKEYGIKQVFEGIKYWKNGYAVGYVDNAPQRLGYGMKIRNVITLDGEILMEDILNMLQEFFVKYKNLTVYPYPKKYIREYYGLS